MNSGNEKERDRGRGVNDGAVFRELFSYTVYETVMLGRYLHSDYSWSEASKENRDAVMACLDATNLTEIKDRKITELSGGQLQRVYLARTFAQDAPVILLDEPTNHLTLSTSRNSCHI